MYQYFYHQLEQENYFHCIHHFIYIISFKPYTNSLLPTLPSHPQHTHLFLNLFFYFFKLNEETESKMLVAKSQYKTELGSKPGSITHRGFCFFYNLRTFKVKIKIRLGLNSECIGLKLQNRNRLFRSFPLKSLSSYFQ